MKENTKISMCGRCGKDTIKHVSESYCYNDNCELIDRKITIACLSCYTSVTTNNRSIEQTTKAWNAAMKETK